jgi:hypothetical protein
MGGGVEGVHPDEPGAGVSGGGGELDRRPTAAGDGSSPLRTRTPAGGASWWLIRSALWRSAAGRRVPAVAGVPRRALACQGARGVAGSRP